MNKRVLELAMEALENKKALIESEIAALQLQVKGGIAAKSAAVTGQRGTMSAALRKAVGERMRAYWAARRGQGTAPKRGAASKPKRGPLSAAAKAAISKRMKQSWARRRRAAAAKAGK
jgi:hypothetical protein